MKNIQKKLLLPLAILIGMIPLANPLNIFDDLRLFAFDTLQQISPREPIENDPILIIDIDDKSLSHLGQWPWPRDLLSKLVESTELALTTSFDIVFGERDRTGSDVLTEQYSTNLNLVEELKKIKPNDEVFAESMESHTTVVLGSAPNNKLVNEAINPKFGLIIQGDSPKQFLPNYTGMQNNLPSLMDSAAGIGSMSIGGESSVVRSLPTFEVVNGQIVPSLMLETLRVAIGASTYQIKSSNASGELAFGARLLRIVRVLRIITVVPALKKIVDALFETLPRVGFVALLMFIFIYIWAAIGTLVFGTTDPEHWGNIGLAMLTLAQVATYDDWAAIMKDIIEVFPWVWLYFISFILLNAVIMLNMVIGIIVDVMSQKSSSGQLNADENQ